MLHVSDPKAIPTQLRGWDVEVAGQPFEVTIRTFDSEFIHGLKDREMSCTVQSFGRKEASAFAEIQAWLGVQPTDGWSDVAMTTRITSYAEMNGRRMPIHFDRPNHPYKGRVWRVELTQFHGLRAGKTKLEPVATAEISTYYFSKKPFPMNFW